MRSALRLAGAALLISAALAVAGCGQRATGLARAIPLAGSAATTPGTPPAGSVPTPGSQMPGSLPAGPIPSGSAPATGSAAVPIGPAVAASTLADGKTYDAWIVAAQGQPGPTVRLELAQHLTGVDVRDYLTAHQLPAPGQEAPFAYLNVDLGRSTTVRIAGSALITINPNGMGAHKTTLGQFASLLPGVLARPAPAGAGGGFPGAARLTGPMWSLVLRGHEIAILNQVYPS